MPKGDSMLAGGIWVWDSKERSRPERGNLGEPGRLRGVSWDGGVKREAGTAEVRELGGGSDSDQQGPVK